MTKLNPGELLSLAGLILLLVHNMMRRQVVKAKKPVRQNAKRKYTRQTIQPVTRTTINFCEKCGHSIQTQAMGAVIAERLQSGAVVTIDGEKVEYVG